MNAPALSRRSLLAFSAVGAAGALATVAGCSSSKSKATGSTDAGSATATVTIRIPDPGNSGTLAVGKKDGSLAAALAAVGAKVAWTGSTGPFAPAAQELNADALDIAQGSIPSAIAALAQSPGFKLFALNAPNQKFEGILVKRDSPIKTLADLAGKKIACSKGGTSEYLILKALQQNGVDAAKVERTYLAPPQTAAVFNSGQVDAWSTWSTYSIPQIANNGSRLLVTGGDVGSDNYAVWAVRTAFAEQHPKVVKALYDYLHANDVKQAADPEKYVNVFTSAGPQAVTGQQKTLTAEDFKQGLTTDPIAAADIERFRTVAQFFVDQKVTPTLVDVRPSVLDVTGLA